MNRAETLHADLCVVGGGMAGLCAAVAAARRGVRVVLVHDRPVLGGNASSEVRMWIRGAAQHFPLCRESGLIEEIALRNVFYNPTMSYGLWDGVLYDMVAAEPNIRLLLNATCLGARRKNGRLTAVDVWQLTTYRRFIVRAAFFADCSGDCILAESSGAAFTWGREAASEYGEPGAPAVADRQTMGSSCLIQARETDRPVAFRPPAFARRFTEADFAHRMSCEDSRAFARDNFWWIELGGERDTLRDAETIKYELLAAAYGVWDFVKNSGKFDADRWELDWVGFLSGKRESRRYRGDYVLTENDVLQGTGFADEVAYGGWSLDDHDPLGLNTREPPNRTLVPPAPYGIPYRCLYSANVPNLFFAGRNISATHRALSSARVMATCALTGQAAGTAAALALETGADCRGVNAHMPRLQQMLRDDDCYLLHTPRKISAAITFSEHNLSDAAFAGLMTGRERKTEAGDPAVVLPVGQAAEFRFSETYCRAVRLVFDSDVARETCADDRLKSFPNKLHITKNDVPAGPAPWLAKRWRLEILTGGVWQTAAEESDNFRRLVRVPVNARTEGIRLTCTATYGAPDWRLLSADILTELI